MNKKILICMGITILFLGTCITPTDAINTPIKTISSGHTLYVGGSGAGNYTSIQDAINDSIDGDTVFVYDASSPYYESVWIYKSINLIGEDRDTTIIDGKNFYWQCVTLGADGIIISGFTMQNSSTDDYDNYGIIVGCNNSIIEDNIIKNNPIGIGCVPPGSNNIISNNEIVKNRVGIELFDTKGNKVFQNNIKSNSFSGIDIEYEGNNSVYLNHFEKNIMAISCFESENNVFTRNNFIKNIRNVFAVISANSRQIFNKNYWGRPKIIPHFIIVVRYITIILDELPPPTGFVVPYPGIIVDLRPAKVPYNIGV